MAPEARRRWLRTRSVWLVSGVAAVMSYDHIFMVVRPYEPVVLAAIEPLSVDGLVIAATMTAMDAAERGERAPLARFLLVVGVVATLAANILYGLPGGVRGMCSTGWPALAFVGVAETALRGQLAAARAAKKAAVSRPSPGKRPPGTRPRGQEQRGRAARREQDTAEITGHLASTPDISDAALATVTGIPRTTVRRIRRELASAAA
jgi:hypothetical protein